MVNLDLVQTQSYVDVIEKEKAEAEASKKVVVKD